jgi:4-carboxymuconolactone decarboxylase
MAKAATDMTTREINAYVTQRDSHALLADTPFMRAADSFLFEDVWKSALTWREKRLITLTCIAIAAQPYPLEAHLFGALKSGDLSADELHDWALHVAAYAGFPTGAGAEGAIKKVRVELESEAD